VYDSKGQLKYTFKIAYISDDESVMKRYYNSERRESEALKPKIKEFEYRRTVKGNKLLRNITSYKDKESTVTDTTFYEYVEGTNSLTAVITSTNIKGVTLYERREYLEFDKKNNWTKALLYRYDCENADLIDDCNKHEPDYFLVRQIEYF
jgi:hypothetical protein